MTKQEIFDHVATHLLTQGRRSQNPNDKRCLYFGPDGTRCAIGCLYPPEVREAFEGTTYNYADLDSIVSEEDVVDILGSDFLDHLISHRNLLQHLQHIHDSIEPLCWDIALEESAKFHDLVYADEDYAAD